MTKKAKYAINLWRRFQNGEVDAGDALYENVLYNLKPSERATLEYVKNNPGCASWEVARHFKWTGAMAATTLKALDNMGLLERDDAWTDDGRGTHFFVYRICE